MIPACTFHVTVLAVVLPFCTMTRQDLPGVMLIRVNVMAEPRIGTASWLPALQSRFIVVEVAALLPAPYLYSATVMEDEAVPEPTEKAEKGVVDAMPTLPLTYTFVAQHVVQVKSVEVALPKFCKALHVFECARLSVAVIVPDVVTGVEPMVRVEFESERPTEVTVPVPQAAAALVRTPFAPA